MEKEEEKLSQDQNQEETQEVQKEIFEPMEVNITDVAVEKGYATSGYNDPVTIQQWKNGNW